MGRVPWVTSISILSPRIPYYLVQWRFCILEVSYGVHILRVLLPYTLSSSSKRLFRHVSRQVTPFQRKNLDADSALQAQRQDHYSYEAKSDNYPEWYIYHYSSLRNSTEGVSSKKDTGYLINFLQLQIHVVRDTEIRDDIEASARQAS